MFGTVSHFYEFPNKNVNVLLSASKLFSLLLPLSNLHEKTTYEMKLQNCLWNFRQKSESEVMKSTNGKITTILVLSPDWSSISSGIVIRRRLSFWTFNQLFFLSSFFVSNFRFVIVQHAENHNSFSVWFLSTKPLDLQIHWKRLWQTDLSSLITWKVFSVKFSETPQLMHVDVRLDIFLL